MVILCYGYISRIAIKAPLRTPKALHSRTCEVKFSDKPMSLLIASPPSGGKTTVLRDLARKLGERWRVALIDERNEFAATVAGEPQNLIGAMTDVFNSYNKYEGIMTAVKVMSPKILICVESLVFYEF